MRGLEALTWDNLSHVLKVRLNEIKYLVIFRGTNSPHGP